MAGAAIYGVSVATTDAGFSWGQLGAATAIGAGGGALIGTGVGIGAGAGAFAGLGGAVVAGAGEGVLASVTLDTLDNGRIDEGAGVYAASVGTAAATGGALHGVGMGVRALRQIDNAAGSRSLADDDAATLLADENQANPKFSIYGSTPAGRSLTKHFSIDTPTKYPSRYLPTGKEIDFIIDNADWSASRLSNKATAYYNRELDMTSVEGVQGIISAHRGIPAEARWLYK